MNQNTLEEIVQPILQWYDQNKRILPWRRNKDPYAIWISEIMLQQTRIEAVKEYYTRFMKELPTVKHLANVTDERLLKLWEGLGYYNRARNLKKAAQMIMEQYNGMIPTTYHELITLPGIGDYTAGAIASIAFNETVVAVDGNVLRVIARVQAIEENILLPQVKKEISEQLLKIIPKESGDFNEGLMELGECICLPTTKPLCHQCPLQKKCLSYQYKLYDRIPIRIKEIKRKSQEKTIFIFYSSHHKIALSKREEKGLLAGLYEFPNIEQKLSMKEVEDLLKNWNVTVQKMVSLGQYKHVFTHIDWHMQGYAIFVSDELDRFQWKSVEEVDHALALPTAFQVFYRRFQQEL